MPFYRTQKSGDVGTMPPQRIEAPSPGMQLADLTKAQLIDLCELRGVEKVSHYQAKAYYVRRLVGLTNVAAAQKNAPVRAADVAKAAPTTHELQHMGILPDDA